MPKVSVIIPNYNHSTFLPQRIESVLNQTYQDFELIILDDCSQDNSKEIIERYRNHPRVSKIVYNTQNSGSTFKQWEKGISLAEGEYIWLAESDDYCEPNFIETLVTKLDQYPKAGVAYCQSISVDLLNTPIHSWIDHTQVFAPNIWLDNFLMDGPEAIMNFFVYRNVIPNASGVIFRKATYDSTTGINTGMTLNGDWILWVKLLEKSSLLFVSKSLNYFRQHNEKATGRNTKNFNNLKEIFELFKYIEERNAIGFKIKKRMTNIVLLMWINQIRGANIIEGFKKSFKVYKSAFTFNKLFLWNLGSLITVLILKKITRSKNIQNVKTIPVILDQNIFQKIN